MEPTAIITLVEVCFETGVLLVETCKHFRNADTEVRERVVRLEDSWMRIRHQLQFIRRIVRTLDEDHLRIQDEILTVLITKLSLAQTRMEKVVKKADGGASFLAMIGVKKGKYVITRDAIDKSLSDLEDWQRRFDPSWFLIMRIANPIIDQELAAQQREQQHEQQGRRPGHAHQGDNSSNGAGYRDPRQSPIALATGLRDALSTQPQGRVSIFLPEPARELDKMVIPFSSAKAAKRGGQWFIVDRYLCQAGRSLVTQNDDVRELAHKLSKADPWTFGLLSCKGVMKVLDDQRRNVRGFDFIFRVPDGLEVLQSLRQVLLSGEMHYSLTRRVRIAKELAKSVSYVHNFNFVHKNVCPESILLFEDLGSRFSTFLVGFDNFRSADGGTSYLGDMSWERNVYRHPSRQGEFPEESYKMQHDVYSLGVCLLEVGLWKSFVSYTSDEVPRPRYGEAYQEFARWLESTDALRGQNPSSSAYRSMMAFRLKDYFVYLAKERLPLIMGDRYAAVVTTCLTCLDKDNEDFGDESEMADASGIQVAVRFIEKILIKLNEICV